MVSCAAAPISGVHATGSGGRRIDTTGRRGVTGVITIADDMPVQPGSRCDVRVVLQRPVAIDVGLTFAMREGNRTIGAGTITAIGQPD